MLGMTAVTSILAKAPHSAEATQSIPEQSSSDFIPERAPLSGPGSTYTPRIAAAFVRRKEEYGMWWPGAVYDGEAARRNYTAQIQEASGDLGIELQLRHDPIYSLEEAEQWIADAGRNKVDGLVVLLLDRQQHAWPTVQMAAESHLPVIVFSPLGTSFTTNTIQLAHEPGCLIYSTDHFDQAARGLKMLAAGARLKKSRCIVLQGDKRYEEPMPGLGTTLRYIPARTYIEEYQQVQETDEVVRLAQEYIDHARLTEGPDRTDIIHGAKSYVAARTILQQEQGDAITMDCLGTLADENISLPCLAWSRMNDSAIPAACEADIGAVASHMVVQNLFDRPGFQQDPVADTLHQSIIGAHCSSPLCLRGFGESPEPYDLRHHHGNRDAIPRPLWKEGQRVTSLDVLFDDETTFLISTGYVLRNEEVPPSGGCIVSVNVKFDGDQEALTFPGFHQVFFYGDYKRQLQEFGQLFRLRTERV